MKEKFNESDHCLSKVHCVACRTREPWREKMKIAFDWDGECPYGVTEKNLEKKMPSLFEQAKNAVIAAAKVAKAKAKGEEVLVSEEVKAERQKICDSCEFYDIDSSRCFKCGCATEYKLKLATESCPEDKWQATKKKKPSFMLVNLKDK